MTPLFFSCVCDFCDGVVDEDTFDQGFVVLRDRSLPSEEYVFQTRAFAQTWKRANGLTGAPIVRVRAPVGFRWRRSTGSLPDLVTADRLVTIYPDHRFVPQEGRAYVSPSSS